jgi:serine/threonine protein kinase
LVNRSFVNGFSRSVSATKDEQILLCRCLQPEATRTNFRCNCLKHVYLLMAMNLPEDGKIHEYDDDEQVPYDHVDVLGKGNSGLVERVRDKGSKLIFARKTISFPRRKQAEAERIFRNEVKVIARLRQHYHFIQVAAAYKTKKHFGIILHPVADEGDLAEFLEVYWERQDAAQDLGTDDTKLQNARSILKRAFGCLASGLAFMHEQRIRHKDIKPQNILIHQGAVIFTDFGYSLDSSQLSNSATEGRLEFLTKKYSAAEVLARDTRDSHSDVWSLGCVFLELLSALTLSYSVETVESYSQEMTGIHAMIDQKNIPLKYSLLLDITTAMTSQKATSRPSSRTVATQLMSHNGFICRKCQDGFKEPIPSKVSLLETRLAESTMSDPSKTTRALQVMGMTKNRAVAVEGKEIGGHGSNCLVVENKTCSDLI